jgi:hypothetical protein
MLVNTFGKILIENCRFHTPMAAILCGGAVEGKWYEAGPVEDLEITGCTFDRCGYMHETEAIRIAPAVLEGDLPYHRNIRIHHNRFINDSGEVLYARHAEGLEFTENEADGSLLASPVLHGHSKPRLEKVPW